MSGPAASGSRSRARSQSRGRTAITALVLPRPFMSRRPSAWRLAFADVTRPAGMASRARRGTGGTPCWRAAVFRPGNFGSETPSRGAAADEAGQEQERDAMPGSGCRQGWAGARARRHAGERLPAGLGRSASETPSRGAAADEAGQEHARDAMPGSGCRQGWAGARARRHAGERLSAGLGRSESETPSRGAAADAAGQEQARDAMPGSGCRQGWAGARARRHPGERLPAGLGRSESETPCRGAAAARLLCVRPRVTAAPLCAQARGRCGDRQRSNAARACSQVSTP